MRERGQASVETVALIAAVLALAAALLFGIARFAPPLASALGRALSGVVTPSAPAAPGLDGLESAILTAAAGPEADGPTVLDVRTHLRSRLGRSAGDAAFATALRPLVEQALPSGAPAISSVGVVDNASETAWLRTQFHPDGFTQAAGVAIGLAGTPGAVYSLAGSLGLLGGEQPDGLAPGSAAGDVVVRVGGRRTLVLRRRAGHGLEVIADTTDSVHGAPR